MPLSQRRLNKVSFLSSTWKSPQVPVLTAASNWAEVPIGPLLDVSLGPTEDIRELPERGFAENQLLFLSFCFSSPFLPTNLCTGLPLRTVWKENEVIQRKRMEWGGDLHPCPADALAGGLSAGEERGGTGTLFSQLQRCRDPSHGLRRPNLLQLPEHSRPLWKPENEGVRQPGIRDQSQFLAGCGVGLRDVRRDWGSQTTGLEGWTRELLRSYLNGPSSPFGLCY